MSKGLWKASADGIADLITWTSGRLRDGAADLEGRIWTRLFVDGAAVSSTNPLPVTGGTGSVFEVQGNVANDDPDGASKPVKIGALAVSDPATGMAAAVGVGDRANAVSDGRGRTIVVAGGDVDHDAPNSFSAVRSKPVLIGGNSVTPGTQQTAVSTAGDRVAAAYTFHGLAKIAIQEDPLSVATGGWTYLFPTAGDASSRLIIKASGGRLRIVKAINTSGGTLYFQIHNTTAVGTIATGTRAWCSTAVPAGGEVEQDFGLATLVLGTGIAVAFSTAQLTFAAPATTGEYCAVYA